MAKKLKVWEKIMKIAPRALAWLKPLAVVERMACNVMDHTCNKLKDAGKELLVDAQQKTEELWPTMVDHIAVRTKEVGKELLADTQQKIEKLWPTVVDHVAVRTEEVGKKLATDAQQKLDDSCAKAMREFDDILGRHRLKAEKQIVRLLWLSFALLSVVGVLLLGIAFILFRVI